MNEKEAYDKLANLIADYVCSGKTKVQESEIGVWRCALNALDKQIPKKPVGFGECPCCRHSFVTSHKYCPVCGQCIDWSVE